MATIFTAGMPSTSLQHQPYDHHTQDQNHVDDGDVYHHEKQALLPVGVYMSFGVGIGMGFNHICTSSDHFGTSALDLAGFNKKRDNSNHHVDIIADRYASSYSDYNVWTVTMRVGTSVLCPGRCRGRCLGQRFQR